MRLHRTLPVLALLLAGCSSEWEEPKPAPKATSSPAVASLKVPPGHYPPPGMCRVWIPGRPPGHQPKSTSCAAAMQAAPPGAWVIHRPHGKRHPLEVSFFDPKRAGVVIDVQLYDPDSGVLLRGTVASGGK
jgi:hypothetical protein